MTAAVLAGQAGRQAPYHRPVPGPRRGQLVRREQAFRRVDNGCVGESGNSGVGDLDSGLGEVEGAADPGRSLA